MSTTMDIEDAAAAATMLKELFAEMLPYENIEFSGGRAWLPAGKPNPSPRILKQPRDARETPEKREKFRELLREGVDRFQAYVQSGLVEEHEIKTGGVVSVLKVNEVRPVHPFEQVLVRIAVNRHAVYIDPERIAALGDESIESFGSCQNSAYSLHLIVSPDEVDESFSQWLVDTILAKEEGGELPEPGDYVHRGELGGMAMSRRAFDLALSQINPDVVMRVYQS